jgi:plasmid maintenance system killer protein
MAGAGRPSDKSMIEQIDNTVKKNFMAANVHRHVLNGKQRERSLAVNEQWRIITA